MLKIIESSLIYIPTFLLNLTLFLYVTSLLVYQRIFNRTMKFTFECILCMFKTYFLFWYFNYVKALSEVCISCLFNQLTSNYLVLVQVYHKLLNCEKKYVLNVTCNVQESILWFFLYFNFCFKANWFIKKQLCLLK